MSRWVTARTEFYDHITPNNQDAGSMRQLDKTSRILYQNFKFVFGSEIISKTAWSKSSISYFKYSVSFLAKKSWDVHWGYLA